MAESRKENQNSSMSERVLAVFADGRPQAYGELFDQFGSEDSDLLWLVLAIGVSQGDLLREGETYFPSQQLLRRIGMRAEPDTSNTTKTNLTVQRSPLEKGTNHSSHPKDGKRCRTEDWLRSLLQEPRLAEEVLRLALEAGIRPATLRRAKQAIGVISFTRGGYFGGNDTRWRWCLPEDA